MIASRALGLDTCSLLPNRGALQGTGRVAGCGPPRGPCGQLDDDLGAHPHFALHRDDPPHLGHHLAAQVEAEADAARRARRLCPPTLLGGRARRARRRASAGLARHSLDVVGILAIAVGDVELRKLGERLEAALDLLRRHTDAGVDDLEPQAWRGLLLWSRLLWSRGQPGQREQRVRRGRQGLRRRHELDLDVDAAVPGRELERVRDDVEKDLGGAIGVEVVEGSALTDALVDMEVQGHVEAVEVVGETEDVLGEVDRRDLRRVGAEVARRQPCTVEQVVDEGEEQLATGERLADALVDVVAISGDLVQGGDAQHADHAREWRLELVRHRREEKLLVAPQLAQPAVAVLLLPVRPMSFVQGDELLVDGLSALPLGAAGGLEPDGEQPADDRHHALVEHQVHSCDRGVEVVVVVLARREEGIRLGQRDDKPHDSDDPGEAGATKAAANDE